MFRSSSIRLTSALVALVWIAAPLAAAFHGMAEVHRYCAEHRGFEEGAQANQTDDVPRGDDDAVDEGRPTDHAGDHQACAFNVVWRSDQTLPGPDLHEAPVPAPAEIPPISREAPRLADVLASAPKTSPPHPSA